MEKPIRVLHIVTCMNLGGLETMIMNYYRKLDTNKIQFDFLVHRKEKCAYDEEILQRGGKIYTVPKLNPFSIKYRNALNGFFKTHNYDIVHCHLDCMSSIPLSIAKKYKVKVRIAHAHNTDQEKNLKYPLKMIYKRKIKSKATNLFACGYEAGKWMFCTDDFIIMKNAIDAKKFIFNEKIRLQEREKRKIHDNFVIGHVGRFNIQKNHMFIIDIFYEITEMNKDAKLILIGEGVSKEEIKKRVTKLGLSDKVIFVGRTNDINVLLNTFDIFLFPSLHEGLPLTMIEAQASGLKCFLSDTISNECIFTNNTFKLSLRNSPKYWADEIMKYRKSYERVDMLDSIRKAGYDIDENVIKLEEYYRYVTEK